MLTDESVLVPPGRLAALLSSRRKALGLDIAQMASRSNGKFSAIALSDLERGRVALDDASLRDLTALYELEAGPVVPARSRLIVDLGGGEMRVGATGVPIEGDEIDSVLERYLSLLYLLRNLKPGTPLTLRDPDVAALSEALEHSIAEVEQRLGQLMLGASVEKRSRLLSKRIMVPGAGLLVGVTAVGALVIVGGSAADAGKLSTPSLSSASVAAQIDNSASTLRSPSAPIRIADSSATPGDRLILPSGVVAEIVEPGAAGVLDRAAVAPESDVAEVAAADAKASAPADAVAPIVGAADPPAVVAEAIEQDVADQASPAVVDDEAPVVSDGSAIERTALDEPTAVEPAAVPAVEAAPEVVEVEQAVAEVAPVADLPPVAPVHVPAIVIPEATATPTIRVIVPDPAPPVEAPAAPTSEVELADAVQVTPTAAPAAEQGGDFNVESSELAGPGFIINEAPDDDLVPNPTPEPVEITQAPVVVSPVDQYARLGAEAEALIRYDFRSHLPGWTFRYEGDTPGYRGLTNLPTKTISIYVNDGDTAFEVAEILGHEVGHALDVTYLNDDDRYAWLEARNMPSAWWPGDGLSDFHVGAGDWAEGVAAYLVGSPSYSAYGGFTPAQLQLVGELLPR